MRLLRKALEEISSIDDNKEVVLKGPLSDSYTQALNVALAKPEEANEQDVAVAADTLGLESAAIDTMLMQQLAKTMSANDAPPTDNYQTVYGVRVDSVSDETVVDVTKELAHNEPNSEFVLIIDGTQPSSNSSEDSAPVEKVVEVTAALECMVKAFGGKVYGSFKEFATKR